MHSELLRILDSDLIFQFTEEFVLSVDCGHTIIDQREQANGLEMFQEGQSFLVRRVLDVNFEFGSLAIFGKEGGVGWEDGPNEESRRSDGRAKISDLVTILQKAEVSIGKSLSLIKYFRVLSKQIIKRESMVSNGIC
jgi:hypothetical protein